MFYYSQLNFKLCNNIISYYYNNELKKLSKLTQIKLNFSPLNNFNELLVFIFKKNIKLLILPMYIGLSLNNIPI